MMYKIHVYGYKEDPIVSNIDYRRAPMDDHEHSEAEPWRSYVTDVSLSIGDTVSAHNLDGEEVQAPPLTFYQLGTFMSDQQLRGIVFNEQSIFKLYVCLEEIFGDKLRKQRIAEQN